jgi:hypothetical protein
LSRMHGPRAKVVKSHFFIVLDSPGEQIKDGIQR